MTSVERARRFIQGKGRTIALTLVPLASLATITMPARASSVTFSTGGCSSTVVGSGSAVCGVTALPATNGVSMSGMGSATSGSSPGAELGVQFNASGSASGTFGPGTIPYRYDFIIGNSNSDTLEYILNVEISTTGSTLNFQVVQPTTGSGTITANTGLTISSAATITGYEFDIDLADPFASANESLTLTIPAGQSIDLGGSSISSVPEPSTLTLAGTAIAGLLWWRRRKTV